MKNHTFISLDSNNPPFIGEACKFIKYGSTFAYSGYLIDKSTVYIFESKKQESILNFSHFKRLENNIYQF